MKKFLALLSVLVLSMSMLVGCGSKSASNDELVVYFVPSRDPAEILEATKPLSEMLKAELSKLGYDVARARELKHMTQKELSKITGIYQSDISKIERGIANPSVATLKRIADGMNMELKIEFINIKWWFRL